jgi:predicted Zn-dependent protease
VDPATALMTGLTRDGVYVVESGRVVGAANNFRFNESPVDLLVRATEVGTPVRTLGREIGEYLNRTIMPPLRIPDYNMSTVSQAS